MQAADIYHEGWAPEVWLARESQPASDLALRSLGIEKLTSAHYDAQVLDALGVPEGSVHVIPGEARNTAEEIYLVVQQLDARQKRSAILVTSKTHTRRVRALWHRLAGQLRWCVDSLANDRQCARW